MYHDTHNTKHNTEQPSQSKQSHQLIQQKNRRQLRNIRRDIVIYIRKHNTHAGHIIINEPDRHNNTRRD